MHMKPMHAFMADDVVFSSDRRRLDGLPHQVCASRHRYRVAYDTWHAPNCVALTEVAEPMAPVSMILTNIKVHFCLHAHLLETSRPQMCDVPHRLSLRSVCGVSHNTVSSPRPMHENLQWEGKRKPNDFPERRCSLLLSAGAQRSAVGGGRLLALLHQQPRGVLLAAFSSTSLVLHQSRVHLVGGPLGVKFVPYRMLWSQIPCRACGWLWRASPARRTR